MSEAAGPGLALLGSGELSLRRVKRAYEQVADQLRELILIGRLESGAKLPTEVELAVQLGVSRSTVREALRQLSAEGLVRTAKGTGGGSYVSRPSLDRLSVYLTANISLLSNAAELSLSEFLEARELLEVPAARLAAARGTEEGLGRLRTTIPGEQSALPAGDQFILNRDFHSTIVELCANALVSLAAAPIFLVLQTRLARTRLDEAFFDGIARQHREICAAVAGHDTQAAGEAMTAHLHWLRPAYERAWRSPGEDG